MSRVDGREVLRVLVKKMMDREGVLPKHLIKVWDAGTTTHDRSEVNTLSKDEFFSFMHAIFEGIHPDLWDSEVRVHIERTQRSVW